MAARMAPEFDYLIAFETIKALLSGMEPVSAKMHALIASCERQCPHGDWVALKQLPFDQEAHQLKQWFRRLFENEPPETQIAGLWFGLYYPNPVSLSCA